MSLFASIVCITIFDLLSVIGKVCFAKQICSMITHLPMHTNSFIYSFILLHDITESTVRKGKILFQYLILCTSYEKNAGKFN